MTQLKHINLARPRWDQLYYENLAVSLSKLVAYALGQDGPGDRSPRVLDIGCGRGELLRHLAGQGYRAMGVDLEPACAIMSREYAPVIVADFLTLDRVFAPSTFDVVISSNTLEHVENPRRAIHIMKHLSRRWIIIVVPNLVRLMTWFLRRPRYVNSGHLQGWDIHHLKTLLEKNCGLRIVRWWPDPVTLPPLRRTFLLDTPPLRFLENQLLPAIAPHLANALVVLCEPSDDDLVHSE